MNEILLGPVQQRWPRKAFFKRLLWTAASSCALGGLYWFRFDPHWMRIERHDMPIRGLGKGFDGATIAHIADLHCSPIVLQRYLRHCVNVVNGLGVDFVAITGDFITGPKFYARRIARLLRGLTPKVATVACLGNHDYGVFHPSGLGRMRGMADYLSHELSHADVFVMLNEMRRFTRGDSTIQFVGLEDYWTPRYNPDIAFELAHHHLPTVALCHNPDPADDLARRGADWVLAGHTHGTPTNKNRLRKLALPSKRRHFFAGKYHLGDEKYLYVNRGLSYGARRNINSRPEITVFTLRDAK